MKWTKTLLGAFLRLRRWPAVLAAITVMAVAGVASAHVTVWPQQSPPGAFEKYTVRVPTEKNVPTVKIAVHVPQGVTVEDLEPVPGWTYQLQKENGRVTTVVWQATGGGIAPGEFQEFSFTAKNPSQPVDLAWKAYQYYKDGSVVEWTGPKGAQTPASITVIAPAAPTSATGSVQAGGPGAASPGQSSTTAPGWAVWVALILSVVSIVLSLMGLRWRRSGATQ
ncbi:YcnI family copper-binding membrane protein [Kyrpidia spormannii]|uniref:Membrane protein involved in copper intake n=2 Tax=Kyrpidia spormannii TaxID=2055160 RepID=A0ACA8Z756_9BACL|nr:YcnI family protein [Kyrpidia spormannii]CAB3390749.1 putative membrane protein involved in copper intake [Kyrpidia spormannii]CAB3391665.1 putative membrane protein involved in copper intake [Kyrpidia spormannii]